MDVPGNWWESFFNGVAVDLWLKAIPPSLTEMEADLIVHACNPRRERSCWMCRAGAAGWRTCWPREAIA